MTRYVLPAMGGALVTGWYVLTGYRAQCKTPVAFAAAHLPAADYVDQYCAPLRAPATIDQIANAAVQRGRELHRDSTTVVFEDRAPGLTFTVSYEVDPDQRSLLFATAVKFEGVVGRWYFLVIRPFHRVLAPIVPVVTARRVRRA